MTSQDYNKAIAYIIPLIVKNNAGRVAIAFKEAGYSKNYIPSGELEARLFQLHNINPQKFYEVMNTIPWNYGEVETNKPEIRDRIIEFTGTKDSREAKGDWWKNLLASLFSQPQQQQGPVAYTTNTGAMIGLVVVAIGIIVALIFIVRS